jgi:hypothetical protein
MILQQRRSCLQSLFNQLIVDLPPLPPLLMEGSQYQTTWQQSARHLVKVMLQTCRKMVVLARRLLTWRWNSVQYLPCD